MYGQGNYDHQTGQGPNGQLGLPAALPPPPTSSQPLAASNSVMHRPPAAVPSQINQLMPMYDRVPHGMTSTTNPSHTSLPQPPPVDGRTPVTGPYLNSQHNPHYPLRVGSHHFPTPSPPPPPPPPPHSTVCPSKREFTQAAPLPPLVQGHTAYWHPANLQPQQPSSVQGPPIPSPNSGPIALATAETHAPSLAPPPPRPESLGKGYGSISALGRSTALEMHIHPAPPKPADEKIVKRIETLCQFIAKNGPGFEDMARTRESANPEFKFLFGGEPGSDAAVAHEYYQWAKKKYIFGHKLHEDAANLGPSEADISAHPKPFIMTSIAHPNSDSDMEMEDDITQVDMDQEMKRPVEYYCQDSDLVCDDHDVKELAMPQIVQCASAQDSSCDKVPSSEVLGGSNYGHQGSGILPNHKWWLSGSPSNRIHSDSNLPEPAGAGIAKNLTAVPADASSPRISSPAVKSVRPFRLVQDYASDDSSENSAVVHSEEERTTVELSVAPGHINKSDYTEYRSESDLQAANLSKIEQAIGPLLESGKSFVAPTCVSTVKSRIVETVTTSSEIGLSDKPSDTNYHDQGTFPNAASSEALAKNNSLRSLSTGSLENGKSEKETGGEKLRSNSTAVQVDEFGRLVRKGASDSDSDDSFYSGRRRKKRERSRSRSQSPVGRRSRRRSLQRTRDRRNQSRSWSPRGRRSRSKSPVMRHVKEIANDGNRRNKNRMPECFDFLRGRCYRGASCRYWHHEAEMEQSKRHWRREHTPEMPLRSKKHDSFEERENLPARVSYGRDSEGKTKPWRSHKNVPDGISDAVEHEKRDYSLGRASRAYRFCRDGRAGEDEPKNDKEVDMHRSYRQLVPEDDSSARIPCTKKFEEGVGTHMPISVDGFIEQPLGSADSLKSFTDNAFKSAGRAVSSQSSASRDGPQIANNLPQLDNPSQPLPDQKTMMISASESLPEIPHHPSQLPQHLSPFIQGAVTGNLQQVSGDHVMQKSPYASQVLPSSMLSSNQRLVSAPQNSNWSSVLPPQPFPHVQYESAVTGGGVTPALYTDFQQSDVSHTDLSPRKLKSYPTGVSAHSHVGEFPPGAYSGEPVPGQSLKPREDYRSSTYAAGNLPGPQVAGPGSTVAAPPNESQCYPSASLPPPEVLKFSSQAQPYLQQQNPAPGLQHSGSAFASSGRPSSSTFLPDDLGGKQTSALDYVGLRSSCHNPYASTFEQPLISKFASGAFGQDYHSRYNTAFPFSHAPVDGIGIGSIGSRQTNSSPKSATLRDQALPRVGGDQYDPLFDSIEPSSSSVKKVDRTHKGESVDSDVILRTSDSNTPLDVEENNKRKEIGAFAPSISVDDDGFGETAEVEVGAVENASVSNPIDAADATEVEMEIDQIKSPGKSKKRKDSRSMKLFKISLADFVKEVLRPSWRQGNMSKEAFKTIVKKTVDKVTGAMKSHHIPKSQAKINHYIDSSQRKLTKLVMGYVDKYVNV